MLEFISIPLVVGIVTLGIYKLFELYARRKERLAIIEKMGDKFDPSMLGISSNLFERSLPVSRFGTLKIACLLLGIGLGLMVGYFITINTVNYNTDSWQYRNQEEVIYGASVMLFGGLGLLISFLIEIKNRKA